ncbi:MAG TPA: protein kinase, partial [Bryobacteraceae bacterium]|nr:protein kinase [Bryobacteraceae bacterium]
AAHEQGLVHRDLKPSNIFVLEDDTVKVIDFGVVHLSGAQSMTGLKGTLQYMSPEQLEMKPATPISDIFALGVVCYEALTGRKPFARQTEAETADAVRRYIPPPISEINPTVSQLVSRVVHKAMAKQPWHRYSSARDFAETLQKAVNNQPIERFDRARIQPRIERIKRAHSEGDHQFAQEILNELEAEGNIDPEMTVLRIQIEQAVRQKTIRQLLDSARTRLEEEEYPLALQKIQEVLDIDPQNVDATNLRAETETLRSKTQIESWFRLVRQHIDNQSYGQARQGLQQILKLNANDTQARALLAEIDRKEQEIVKLRTEKESLYQSAVGSYQNGEISAALSKLERILDLNRRSPDSAAPERDAQYQSLYNQVRTERETARSSYAEGRRHLADRNFTKAAEICDDFLKKYPNDPMFQALKLEVEEQQRQEQSAYIAEVGRRVEAEADLDRRVNVLREAVERYPNEPQFQQALRLIRDRRDLVNSIVAKARQYEERGQFNDALGQWDILRNIYPQYPGLEFEVQRVVRRREDQAREESKARWVEQIDRSIETGAHQRAVEVAHNALAEFPDDAELAGLERIARQGLERSIEAQKWLSEGQRLCLERQYAEGLQALRKASELDPRNQVTRDALLNALVEQARSVMAQDWRAAEPLVQQALQIDPGHPLAKNLQALVLDYKRQQIVNECVAQAREYQVNGNLPAALAKVEDVLAAWPNEVRLLQLRSTLRNQLVELQRATSAATAPPEPVVPPPPARPVVPPPPSITETLIDPDLGQSTAGVKGINLRPSERNRGVAVETPIPSTPPHAAPPVRRKSPAAYWQKAMTSLQTLGRGARRWSVWQWSAAASVPVILLAGYLIAHRPGRTGGVGLSEYEVSLDSNVIGAQYLVDGQPVVSLPVKLKQGEHRVEALAAGYRREVASFTLSPGAARPFVVRLQLEPEPRHLRLVSDLKSGSVVLDNKPAVDLLDGAFELEDLPPGDHTLKIVDRSRELAQFTFSSDPGGMVSLTAPVQVKDLSVVVVSSLANRARVYGSSSLKANLEGQPLQPIPGEGLELKNLSGSNNELSIDDGKGSRHVPIELGNAPLLNIFLGAGSDSGTVVVQANVPAAHLVVDGQPVRQMLRNGRATLSLSPKEHLIRLSQEGYQTSTDVKVDVKKGETQMVRLELKPLASSTALVIQGTPEAEVWIDGSRAGATDATGVYTRTELAPGSHTITVKKANFEEQVFQENAVAGGSLNLSANLKALAILNLRVSPATARITYKREG